MCVKSPCQASAVYFNINNALLFNGALFFYTSDCVLNLYVVICSLNGKKSVLVYTAVKWICCLKSNRCVLFGWCKIALTCTHSHINSQHIFWLTETLYTRSIVTKWFYLHIKPLEYSIHETDHFSFHCNYIRPARHSLPMHSTHSYCSVVYTVTEVLYTFTAVLYSFCSTVHTTTVESCIHITAVLYTFTTVLYTHSYCSSVHSCCSHVNS